MKRELKQFAMFILIMAFLCRGVKTPVNERQTKVLVVDDEAAILDMIRFALEQAGFLNRTVTKRP
jgi:PleD family two-component response regulator